MHSSIASLERTTRPERLRRWAHVFVDGTHPWGVLSVGLVDRTGQAMRYRLVVYPPGISTAQRRALVLRRRWPAFGTFLGIFISAVLGTVMNGWAALGVGAAVFVAGFVVTGMAAGDASRRTARLTATVVNALGHCEVLGNLNALERAAGQLLELDEQRDAGLLSPAQYEHLWGQVHLDAMQG